MAQDFPTTGSPPMIGRKLSISEWEHYVATYDFGSLAPSRLVLHHTYRPTEDQWRGLASMRGMQQFYGGKGWTAAPHIYVAPDGIWLFTPMSQIGIHAGTGNGSLTQGWYSIGLEMVGYFDNRRPSGIVWDYAKAVMGALSRRLNIPPHKLISFHRDYTNQKSCPGWAVTKEWVWGEIEAWMQNTAPPPPPPQGSIGQPTPSEEKLIEAFLNESYAKRTDGQGYNNGWAFHQYALQHSLGMPIGKSTRIQVDGKTYNYQPFARDTLFCEIPNWGDVQTLTNLLSGSIPPSGLGRALLEATYQAGGATFHPEWAFHQYAMSARLGPPIGQNSLMNIDDVQYSFQVFAGDTLYNRVPDWADVQQLSRLANTTDPAKIRLRDVLLAETYKRSSTTYHPEWSFHQLARTFNIGAPLSHSYQITVETTTYAIQVYAWDTLYNIVPKWSEVQRLSALGKQTLGQAVSFDMKTKASVAEAEISGEPSIGTEIDIVRYNLQEAAFSSREGAAVDMVILHGLAGSVDQQLAHMTTVGARFTIHYYIAQTGRIYQLVEEELAAWHASLATLDGLWFNLNRVSIGIGLEFPEKWPDIPADLTSTQLNALQWLLRDLVRRYRLGRDSIVLWNSLASNGDFAGNGLPLDTLRHMLEM